LVFPASTWDAIAATSGAHAMGTVSSGSSTIRSVFDSGGP
jgi:hypothetical protein